MEVKKDYSPDKYDYIVIGTGPAGFVSSIKAFQYIWQRETNKLVTLMTLYRLST